LAESDFAGIFRIPQKLYGREKEINVLLETFERISVGPAELLLVAGYSGTGKTALVHEVQKPITAKQGYFIEGKFDQFQRNIPYSGWGQAFGAWVTHLLMESESQLDNWKTRILEAVGLNGKLLTDVIPHLELVIGPQPDVPELDGQATQIRFNNVFQRFIKVIAGQEHPLVVFLDDLQWIDSASLNVLKPLLTDPGLAHCLIIGAYRDNEVEAPHPLMMGVAELQEANIKLERLTLDSLSETDLNALCSDTLRCPPSESRPLTRLIHTKTDGNAFFSHRLLHALHEDKLLAFDSSSNRWQWDLDALNQLELAENVIDLMVAKVRKLPEATKEMLQLAACIGNQFEVSTLTRLTQQPEEVINEILDVSLKENILIPVGDLYKFAHDRIQQAVYSLIHPDARGLLHRRIGFSLMDNTPADELEDTIFDIVGHLNQALDAIDKDDDRILISKLNLKAGQKAKFSAAYSDAKKYIEAGLKLQGSDSWQQEYELTLSLHNENGHLAALTGPFEQVDATAELIKAHAKNILDKNRIDMIRIEAETLKYNLPKALQIGLEALKDLGMDIPMQPTQADYQSLKDRLVELLEERSEKNWVELPEMTDGTALAISALLASEMSTSFVGYPPIYTIVSYANAILTLEHGIGPWSPFAFVGIASVEIFLADPETPPEGTKQHLLFAKEMRQIARELLEAPVTAPSWTKTTMIMSFISVYLDPMEKAVDLTLATYRSGYQTGDMLYGAYGINIFAINSFGAGMNLTGYRSQLLDYRNLFNRMGQVIAPTWLSMYAQTVQNFMEPCSEPQKLQGDHFDEELWMPQALALNDMFGRNMVSVNKLILAYHFDVDDQLEHLIREAEEVLIGGRAIYTVVSFYLYAALSKLRLVGERGTKQFQETIDLVASHLQLMKVWSEFVPSTYQHKYDLIAAEIARVTGNLEDALSHYEQAIDGARSNGFIHEEALANELYGRFWMERDNGRFAGPLLDEAHNLYLKWGAAAKAKHLVKRYPECMKNEQVPTADEATAPVARLADQLDLHTILKASQKIVGEIELKGLLANMMDIVIENAGAQKGFLLMEEEDRWRVVAGSDFECNEALAQEPQEVGANEVISQGIVHYVNRTQQGVVLTDATHEGDFTHDLTIQQRQSKSVLCTPLINQGLTSGILYLENNLAVGAFTLERVELLNLLSSQMALALDNATLYSTLKTRLAELSESESRFRAIFEQAAVGIAHVAVDGHFLRLNQKFCDIVGYPQDEMRSKSFQEITHPDDLDKDLDLLSQLLNGEADSYTLEKRYLHKDSSVVWVNLTVKIVRNSDNSSKWFVSVIEDISERIQAIEDLSKSEAKFRDLVDNSMVGIFNSTLDGQFLFVNEALAKLYHFDSPEQMMAESTLLLWVDLKQRKQLISELQKHGNVSNFEAETITGPNQHNHVLFSVKLQNNIISGLVMDITERRHAQDQVRAKQERLRAMASELVLAEERERKRISSDLHDGAVQSLAVARLKLAEVGETIAGSEAAGMLDDASQMVRHSLEQIREVLLDLSSPSLREIGLDAALSEWLDDIGKKHHIRTEFCDKCGDVLLPNDLSVMLFRNARELLTNVIKHGSATKISVRLACSERTLRLTVEDDGVGFEPEA
jgi:PAS domain S-box-containing protein